MTGILTIIENILIFFRSLFIIDFSNYSGSLSPEFIEIYNNMASVYTYIAVGIVAYLILKAFIFIVSLGSIK